jgi:hypothetical protein
MFKTLLASYFSPISSMVKSLILKFRDSERLGFPLSLCLNFMRISIVWIKLINTVAVKVMQPRYKSRVAQRVPGS